MKVLVPKRLYLEAGTYESATPDDVVITLSFTVEQPVTDPPPVDPPAPPAPPVIDPPPIIAQPAPSILPPIPVNDNATHAVIAKVTDGAGRVYRATATTGNDPTAPRQYKPLTDVNGAPHRGLTAHFYDDCVEVSVTRADAPYDEMNCRLEVTYDGLPASVPPSSFADGHYDFWRGLILSILGVGNSSSYSGVALVITAPADITVDQNTMTGYGGNDFTHLVRTSAMSAETVAWHETGTTSTGNNMNYYVFLPFTY